MAKKPMSDAQKYRRANARGAGPGAEGRAKIKTAEKLDKIPEKERERRNVGEGTIYGLRTEGSRLLGQDYARSIGGKGEPGYYKKGGMVSKKEGTAKDMREDKAMAKKRGMTMAQWEKSAADKKHDAPKKMAKGGAVHKMPDGTTMPGKSHGAPKKMAKGGKIKMVEKGGKKVPAFAADGVGKMAKGGSVRGTGCAIRGKGFSGTY